MSLSDLQPTSITSAIRASANPNRPIAKQLKTKQQTLQTALLNGSTHAPAIRRAKLELQALRKQLETNRAKARVQARSIPPSATPRSDRRRAGPRRRSRTPRPPRLANFHD